MGEFETAIQRAKRRQASQPVATSARYDRERDRIVVELDTGSEFAFPRLQAQGLEAAKPSDLDKIEISPSGFGLHFPKLDADLWLPALLQGIFGSKNWIAAQLGTRGGRAKSKAKARAARVNGKLGGRPRKTKSGRTVTAPRRGKKRA
jgi:Protein of unknown function (DUF2442)